MNRNKKVGDPMQPYYMVIGGFVAVCVLAVLYTIFNPKTKFSEMQVIDQSQILIHNGMGHQFKHGENDLFQHKTLADAKSMFMSALSDTNNIAPCKTSKRLSQEQDFDEMDIEIPESYDWREQYPQCVQPVADIGAGKNCSSSYVFATLGVVQDRICMASNHTVKLSAQEIIDCDDMEFGCEGGYANKVLTWGKKKGFITEECMEYTGKKAECEVDHLESNQCRIENQIYKVNDFCLSMQAESIKREIFTNGPVIG